MMLSGIEYFEDLNCMRYFRKVHSRGIRNIYVVEVEYLMKMPDNSIKNVKFSKPYGTFHLANWRYSTELKADDNRFKVHNISLRIDTYKDTKLIHSDCIKSNKYDIKNVMNEATINDSSIEVKINTSHNLWN